jgi:hypothetical protein
VLRDYPAKLKFEWKRCYKLRAVNFVRLSVETFEELSTPGKPDETASMSLLFSQIANYWTRAQYFHAQCHASELRGFRVLPAPISSGTHIHATERSLMDYWKYLPETKARYLAILTRLKLRLDGGELSPAAVSAQLSAVHFKKKRGGGILDWHQNLRFPAI